MSLEERSQDAVGGLDDAARLDAELTDFDWSILPDGAEVFRFVAPSGVLAGFSLGDPSHPRVVMIPGVTGSKEDFTLLAPVLVAGGYFVQSYDLAGQYQSNGAGPGRDGRYDYPLFVDDLVAFLASGAPAHVLGYSFAGVVAQLVVVAHPELCLSLTLLTAPPVVGQSYRGVRVIGWLSSFVGNRGAASLLIWGIVTNKNKVKPQRLAFVRDRFRLTVRSSVNDIMGLMKHVPDVRSRLAASPVPRLVAVGSHDLWPTELHQKFAAEIGAELVVYATGHSPCETAPNQLGRDMLALFSRAESD